MTSEPPTAGPMSGRVAVVTGSTRGIGKGVAVALGAAGATVYVTGRAASAGTHLARAVGYGCHRRGSCETYGITDVGGRRPPTLRKRLGSPATYHEASF